MLHLFIFFKNNSEFCCITILIFVLPGILAISCNTIIKKLSLVIVTSTTNVLYYLSYDLDIAELSPLLDMHMVLSVPYFYNFAVHRDRRCSVVLQFFDKKN